MRQVLNIRRWAGLALATGVASAAVAPSMANADCDTPVRPVGGLDSSCPDDIGYPVCAYTPFRTPNLSGMPVWPGVDGPIVPYPEEDPVRPEVGDPRWANAPYRRLFVGDGGTRDNAFFRVVVNDRANPTEMAVSIQLRSANAAPSATDVVYFGLASTPDGDTRETQLSNQRALGVKLYISGVLDGADRRVGEHLVVDSSRAQWFDFDGARASGSQWTGARGALPSWITNVSVWNNHQQDAKHGASYIVQFKVNLTAIRTAFGALPGFLSTGIIAAVPGGGVQEYFTPFKSACNGGCTVQNNPALTTNPFISPIDWTPIADMTVACQGINITTVSTDLTCTGVNGGTRSNCVTVEDAVSVEPGVNNGFNSTYALPTDLRYASNTVETTYRMSNWGSVARPSEWKLLGQAQNTSSDPADPIELTCSNDAQGNICGNTIIASDINNSDNAYFHQCLLAELSATQSGQEAGYTFGTPAKYTNTYFATASEIDVVAEINVRSVANVDPARPNRDVYLMVKRTNMPIAGQTAQTLDVPALQALRAQVDPGYARSVGGCPSFGDVCVPTEGAAVCVSYCIDGDSCRPGYVAVDASSVGMGCVCVPDDEDFDTCSLQSLPADGGYNLSERAFDQGQVLTSSLPTYEIFPFYDSGRTIVVDGQTRKDLIPMPSFVVHAWHETDPARGGTPFYGWLTGLTDASGAPLQEVADDVYLLPVSKASGVREIRVHLSAEEAPHFAPLTEIAGAATTLPLGLGNVQIVGVTNGSSAIDLRTATLSIHQLLKDGTKELVRNLNGPVTLTRLPGATSVSATFVVASIPGMLVNITAVPLIGHLVTITVAGATVDRPNACKLLFGKANLGTELRIGDGLNPPLAMRGVDEWSCVPFEIFNL